MKTRFSVVGACALAMLSSYACSSMSVPDDFGTTIIHDQANPGGEMYVCSPDEQAGNVPHHPGEMHCCMTDVSVHQHNQPFSYTDDSGSSFTLSGEVPNYITAEIKAAGKTTVTISGTLVRSYQAGPKKDSPLCCATNGGAQPSCKPTYVRSRYDIAGNVNIHSERELGFSAKSLLAFLPLKLDATDSHNIDAAHRDLSICISEPFHPLVCETPSCVPGTPGCSLGTDGGAPEGGDAGSTGTDSGTATGNACAGTTGSACVGCCEMNSKSATEFQNCVSLNHCG